MEHKKKSVEAAVANSKKAREKQGGIPGINKKASGLKLRRIMDAQGITVKDVQQYLGLGSVQSVYHWLNGISMPTVDNLYAMSELLQVSMDEMVCGNRTRGTAEAGFETECGFRPEYRFDAKLVKHKDMFYCLFEEEDQVPLGYHECLLSLEKTNVKRMAAYYKKAGGNLAA